MSQFSIEPGNRMPAIPHEAPYATRTTMSPAAPGVITQEMLGAFLELNEVLRERDSFRQRIMDMLDAGVPIEPGPLTAHLSEIEQRRFNTSSLIAVLGAEGVERLKMLIRPTVCRTLRVHRRAIETEVTLDLPRPRPVAASRPPRRNMEDHMIHQEPRTRQRRRNSTP